MYVILLYFNVKFYRNDLIKANNLKDIMQNVNIIMSDSPIVPVYNISLI